MLARGRVAPGEIEVDRLTRRRRLNEHDTRFTNLYVIGEELNRAGITIGIGGHGFDSDVRRRIEHCAI